MSSGYPPPPHPSTSSSLTTNTQPQCGPRVEGKRTEQLLGCHNNLKSMHHTACFTVSVSGSNQTTQQVKVLAVKSDDQSSITQIQTVGENQLLKIISDPHMYAVAYTYPSPMKVKCNKNVRFLHLQTPYRADSWHSGCLHCAVFRPE